MEKALAPGAGETESQDNQWAREMLCIALCNRSVASYRLGDAYSGKVDHLIFGNEGLVLFVAIGILECRLSRLDSKMWNDGCASCCLLRFCLFHCRYLPGNHLDG